MLYCVRRAGKRDQSHNNRVRGVVEVAQGQMGAFLVQMDREKVSRVDSGNLQKAASVAQSQKCARRKLISPTTNRGG